MFKSMTKWLFGILLISNVFAQNPIIRVEQLGTWTSPDFWWRDNSTIVLKEFLADDKDLPAFKNNNFDAWRDDIMVLEVTLDDVGSDITAFRFDIAFDNDIITWIEPNGASGNAEVNGTSAQKLTMNTSGNNKVEQGSYLASFTEGDENAGAHYSYEVVYYPNIGYRDSLAVGTSTTLFEQSISDTDYDWLRVTMVSHDVNDVTFGSGNGNETQLIKLYFKIDDVNDNFSAKSFRIPTFYNGSQGYYTYVSDDYLLDYKVYIDGNWGQDLTYDGGARGDITLHPKLVDVEGFFRYIDNPVQINNDPESAGPGGSATDRTYPYWKVMFELDKDNPDNTSNWYNIESIQDDGNTVDEDLSDDVIGNYQPGAPGYYHYQITDITTGTTSDTVVPGEGFLGVSYWDYTYTDDKGYFNIQLPRNNQYRVSFWPPDAADKIGNHTQLELDRGAITNVNDAIASFNFQSGKYHNSDDVVILDATSYLIGDIDGDDVFQLNDAYFSWAYTSAIFDNYTHENGNSYENWSTIDNLKVGGQSETLSYYQAVNGGSTPQRREFTIFVDEELPQETATLSVGQVEVLNPDMMDAHIMTQTGLDTLNITIGAGTSTFDDPDVTNSAGTDGDVNPDYTFEGDNLIDGTNKESDIGYYFTGDINRTGTKVQETSGDGYIDVNGTTFYRWASAQGGSGTAPGDWTNSDTKYDAERTMASMESFLTNPDVLISLPADSTVRVQAGNQVVVPLTIKPSIEEETLIPTKIAGFEFEIEYDTNQLHFIDAQTGLLPGPWLTYLNESEVDVNGYKRISFGGFDHSPNNAPQDYYITEEVVGLQLIFTADFPDSEWTEADLSFVGKAVAGNPNGDDLTMRRQDGKVLVWNKYWAFGGGQPDEDEMTYVYPNPFEENAKFQFFMEQAGNVKVSIYNTNGQMIGVVLDENAGEGIHQFDFTNSPNVWLPEVSVFEGHQVLQPGIYIFVMETENKIKAKKFTILR